MESLGQQFRQAREARKLGLEQVSAETRISVAYLTALEEGRMSAFPAPVFYRGFIRQYATYLDLPREKYEPEIARSWAEEEHSAPPMLPTHFTEKHYDLPPLPTGRPRLGVEARRWAVRLAGLMLVVAGCAGVYEAWRRWPEWMKQTARTQTVAQQSPAAMEPQTEMAGTRQASATQDPAIPPVPEGGVQVVLLAKERTWVEAFNGQQRIFMGLLHPGETKILEGTDRVRVLVGNAGGLEIRHNGKPLGAPGEPGQVLTMDFTISEHNVLPGIVKPRV